MHEVITEDAFKSGLSQFEGLPLTITLDGKKRTIGRVEAARVSADRQALMLTAELTDEEIAGILGTAQDKIEAATSPLGLSNREIETALADVKVGKG
jgi:hypothetical protein